MSAFTDAIYRLTQYNDGPYNAATNPHGFDNQGYVINLPQCTEDIATVCNEVASAAEIVGELDTEIAALGAISAEIQALAPQASNIAILGPIAAAISDVAAIAANVTAVAGNAANINTVAGSNSSITAVAGAITNINLVAAALTNINAVAAQLANIALVAAVDDDVAALGPIAANVTTVAGIHGNVTTVAGISGNVTTVAGISTAVSTVAADSVKISAVYGALDDIGDLAPRAADIATLADIEDGTVATGAIQTVAGSVVQVTNVSTNIDDVSTVAGNISAVNSVAGIASDISAVAGDATDIGVVATNIAAVNSAADNIDDIIAAPAAASAAQGYAGAAKRVATYYTFDSSTTDADPGAGKFRLNNASPAAATAIYFDLLDNLGGDQTAWIEGWDDSTTLAARGALRLVNADDPTIFARFLVTGAVTTATGYRKIAVSYVNGNGSFTATDEFSVDFSRSGDKGTDGEGAGNVNTDGTVATGRFASYPSTDPNTIHDSGYGPSSFATAAQGALADSAVQPAGLSGYFNKGSDTLDVITEGSTNKHLTTTLKSKLDGIEASADVTDGDNVGLALHAASPKTTPVDADTLPLTDSAASNVLKKVTWANIKATLKTYFDGLYAAVSHTHTFASLTSKPTTVAGYGISDLAAVATSGAYGDLSGRPTLGTAAAANTGDFATSTQGGKADTALQPASIGSATEIRTAAADKLISTDDIWLAAANVNLGNLTGTVAINFSDFLGSAKGTMTGAVTLGATSNLKVGQTFVLELLQDATGGRTLAHNATYWQTAGGAALAIDTTPNALNVVVGTVLSNGKVLISLAGKKVS